LAFVGGGQRERQAHDVHDDAGEDLRPREPTGHGAAPDRRVPSHSMEDNGGNQRMKYEPPKIVRRERVEAFLIIKVPPS
jgi:hypothetical protein